jgi:hypothetical protein
LSTLDNNSLANGKTITKEASWLIVKCWGLLEEDIDKRRNTKGENPNYMKNFQDLANKALKCKEKQIKTQQITS